METVFINRREVPTSLQRYTSYIHEDDITQCTNLCRDVCTIVVGYIDEYNLLSVSFKELKPQWIKQEARIFPTKLRTTKEGLQFNYDECGEITLCYNNFQTASSCKVRVYSSYNTSLSDNAVVFDIKLIITSALVRISKGIVQGQLVNTATVRRNRSNYGGEVILDSEFTILKCPRNEKCVEKCVRDIIVEAVDLFKRLLQLCDYVDVKIADRHNLEHLINNNNMFKGRRL